MLSSSHSLPGEQKKSPKSETKIENQKLDFRDKASSKVGSLNNVQHKAGGGDKKIFDDKEYLRQMQGSPCNTSTSKASSEANLSGTQSLSEKPAVVQWNHACFGVRGISRRTGSNPVHGPSVGWASSLGATVS
ncbi:Microtubule-associated protein tau [Portunus trituberculatus]|uniref:Microtubule-associated protein n=1 Tax=Portunus trituberculatus TaxID=210409 RepID=A0A5B7D2V0_PORTR|nr:Microtubule-associated protein tau [Portunus trituberculatus]